MTNRDFCFLDQSMTSIQTWILCFLRALFDQPPRTGVPEQFLGLCPVRKVYIRDRTTSFRIRKGQSHYFSLPATSLAFCQDSSESMLMKLTGRESTQCSTGLLLQGRRRGSCGDACTEGCDPQRSQWNLQWACLIAIKQQFELTGIPACWTEGASEEGIRGSCFGQEYIFLNGQTRTAIP